MGNTSGREGQVVPGAGGSVGAEGGGHGNQVGNAHRLPQYVVPPSGHHHHHPNTIQDSTRIAQVASADSMGQSPSDSPGSAARSPLMFTPQVCHFVQVELEARSTLHSVAAFLRYPLESST